MSPQPLSSRGQKIWRASALPLVLLLAWEASAHLGLVNPHFLPPIEIVLQRGWVEASQGQLLASLGASLSRDLAGFAIARAIRTAGGFPPAVSAPPRKTFGTTPVAT